MPHRTKEQLLAKKKKIISKAVAGIAIKTVRKQTSKHNLQVNQKLNRKEKNRQNESKQALSAQISEFEVEEILDYKIEKQKILYFVSWKGYNSSDNTWEPEQNLCNAPKKIKEFEQKMKIKHSKRQEMSNQTKKQSIKTNRTIPTAKKTVKQSQGGKHKIIKKIIKQEIKKNSTTVDFPSSSESEMQQERSVDQRKDKIIQIISIKDSSSEKKISQDQSPGENQNLEQNTIKETEVHQKQIKFEISNLLQEESSQEQKSLQSFSRSQMKQSPQNMQKSIFQAYQHQYKIVDEAENNQISFLEKLIEPIENPFRKESNLHEEEREQVSQVEHSQQNFANNIQMQQNFKEEFDKKSKIVQLKSEIVQIISHQIISNKKLLKVKDSLGKQKNMNYLQIKNKWPKILVEYYEKHINLFASKLVTRINKKH